MQGVVAAVHWGLGVGTGALLGGVGFGTIGGERTFLVWSSHEPHPLRYHSANTPSPSLLNGRTKTECRREKRERKTINRI